ncbi:UbiX family flavin prenyltransferase [Phaeovulum sp. NW3]|uniref:UbiX family flavin prenyltransferase n=1 Tax=Phaeovulum sp. NW3 TaxID=2934933 RepID=UPI002021FFBE|nr:UbiX family flavin prenyltransferase [Phaeovulum sp. NW3]MCL7466399.1 UbiX family flavin prenyltransferase [Phaeovulum sp. NW3]
MSARVVLGVSGASGAALALDCARALVRAGAAVDLVLSAMAERTLDLEIGPGARDELVGLCDGHHPVVDLGAAIASGSFPVAGMIVAPCSMRSLAAIAHGLDDNLLTRAASVQLKERRPLILLAREAPLTLAHLRNMTAATEMGAVILPPVPAFYLKPVSVTEVTAQIAARAVDLLRLGPPQAAAWTP